MPVYEVTSPDGRKYRVNAPDGATQQDAVSYIQSLGSNNYDPTGSFGENLAAGVGKSVVDTGRRLRQLGTMVGIGDKQAVQQEIDDAQRRDAPLMQSAGGLTGDIAGQIGQALLPGSALMRLGKATSVLGVPGMGAVADALTAAGKATMAPTSIPGAAAVGAAQGFMQPVPSDSSAVKNLLMGAAGGAAAPAAAAAGWLTRDLVAPFFRGGQERLAGRTLERFASDPNAIANANTAQLVPGSSPTLAEATGDVGLAQLQRTLRNNPDANAAITERLVQNQDARLNALRGIAGDPGRRDYFAADRQTAAQSLYDQAFTETPTLTPWIKGQITQLQTRPAFSDALGDAQTLALNQGLNLDSSNVVQVLHYTKLALDDKIGTTTGNQQRALIDTRNKLVSLMESKDFAPSYAAARKTFAAMSQPINQMDVGQELYNKLQPALADFGATSRMRPQAYAQAVRDADATARRATGFNGAKMESILSPQQMGTVQNIGLDLGRAANAQDLGMTTGSPTAQNLISQDLLRGMLGPFGLPQGWAENAGLERLMTPLQWAYKPAEQRVLGLLGNASVDPKEAQRLLELARKRGLLGQLSNNYLPYSAPIGAAGLLNVHQ